MYTFVGMEVVAMIAGKVSSNISYTGSPMGIDFINKRLDILSDFVNFSRGTYAHMFNNMYIHINYFLL